MRKYRCARREDILDTVDDVDVPCRVAEVFELAMAYEAELLAGGPGVPEDEIEIMVDLFVAQLVAQRVFVEVACGGE